MVEKLSTTTLIEEKEQEYHHHFHHKYIQRQPPRCKQKDSSTMITSKCHLTQSEPS